MAEHKIIEKVTKCFEQIDSSVKDKPKFRCTIDGCGRVLQGQKRSNLTRHVRNAHQDYYSSHIARPVTSPKELAIRRLKFIQDCAEIIAINGRSFQHLCQSGHKNLVAEKVAELVEAGYGEGIAARPHNAVRDYIRFQASEIEQQIRNEVKGKFVAIMVDAASRNSKSFLGISLQYVLDGVVTIRNAGVIEILCSHSAKNLMLVIMERLRIFEIKKEQIIAITTDNEPSMISMVKKFNTIPEEEASDAPSDDDDSILYDDEDQVGFVDHLPENDKRLDELLDDSPEYFALIENVLDAYALQTMNIHGIRCAAHTLQLAICSVLKDTKHSHLIDLFRDVAKFLRKPTSIRAMREENIRIWLPRLDVKTRWSSFYLMVYLVLNRTQFQFVFNKIFVFRWRIFTNVSMPSDISLLFLKLAIFFKNLWSNGMFC